MICMMCCTWHVFVVALKMKKASFAHNRGGLPTKNIYIWMLPIKFKGLNTTPDNSWYLVPRLIFCTCMWYLVHNASLIVLVRTIFCTSTSYVVPGTWCIIWLLLCCCCRCLWEEDSIATAQHCCVGFIYHHTHCRPSRYKIRRVNTYVSIDYLWWFPIQNFLTLTALAWSSLSTDSLNSAAFPSRG